MITVHHLDFSRSTRVLWLLEELGIEYDLVRYGRKAGAPAPPSLKTIHPLGTSPVIVDGDLVLAESSAILRYIDREHGGGRFTPGDRIERAVHDEWIDYVEGSLAFPVLATLTGGDKLAERFKARLADMSSKNWRHVDNVLSRGPYLLGDRLTLADMQMSYIVAIALRAGLLENYPFVTSYLDRLLKLAGLQRAVARGGPMTL